MEENAQPVISVSNEYDAQDTLDDYQNYRREYDNESETESLMQELDSVMGESIPEQVDAEPVDIALEQQPELPIDDGGEPERGFLSDIGLGISQLPRHVIRGGTKALNEILDIGADIDSALSSPVIQFMDSEGNFDFDIISQETAAQRGIDPASVPLLDAPAIETTTGNVIEGIAQFLAGFGIAGKALKGVNAASRGGQFVKNVVQGGLGDVIAFDEQEQRLSNLIEGNPTLANPVTEYLQADGDDGVIEAKFKQGLEGLGLGALTDGLFAGVRAIKKARGLRAQGVEMPPSDIVPETPIEKFSFLGDADNDSLILRKKVDDIADKGAAALSEVDGITPETVVKAAKRGPKAIDEIQINYARIEGPDDIKNAMQALANEPALKSSVDKARRGVVPNKVTLKAAEDIDGFDTLVSRRQGEAFNAEQITAARMIYYDATDKLMEAARIAASPEATDIDQFTFRKMIATHHAIQKEVLGARAEAGRALQAWSIPLGGSGAERTKQLEQVLIEFGGADSSKELARKLIASGELTTSQINKITKLSATARTTRALEEAWTLGLLTNPTTHIVNLTSNIITTGLAGVERSIASAIPDSGIKAMEPMYYWAGMIDSQKEAIKNAAKAFRSGQVGIGTGKLELPRVRATSLDELDATGLMKPFAYAMDMWGRVVQNAGKSLAAGDEYSKTVAYKAQVKALAYRQAAGEGLSGDALKLRAAQLVDDTPMSMAEEARDFANYVTFTKELGSTGQAFQKLVGKVPGARFVVPFIRTPANIFKYTFERTPLAMLSSNVRNELKAGGVRAATAQAKIGMGTTVMAIGLDAALQGDITGAGPSDSAARQALMRRGWRPYSIKVGDTYYSYARLEPFATIFGMSADMAELMSNYESYDMARQEEIEEAVSASVMVISNQVVNKTFLSGLADTFEMFSDPGRFGQSFVQRYTGSLVPAGTAAIERAIDPQKEYVFSIYDSIRARIPGNSVAKKFNVWGEPLQNFYPSDDGFLSATGEKIGAMVNPFYYSTEVESPIDDWLLRNGGSVSMPQKNQIFTLGREKYDVDMRDFPEAYSRLVELRGSIELPQYSNMSMKAYLNALVQGDVPMSVGMEYRDVEDNVSYIRSVVSDYQKAAKAALVEEMPDIIGQPREDVEVTIGGRTKAFP